MAARRITRKEMKRDEFVTALGRISLWMEEHVREVMVGAGVVLLLAVGGFLAARYFAERQTKASALLARGVEMVHAPVRGIDAASASPGGLSYGSPEEKNRAALDQMDAVIQTYPGSRAARLALYYRGLLLLDAGRPKEAATALESFLSASSASFAAPMAKAALARALEEAGDGERALPIYEELSKSRDGAYPPEAALMEMGRLLERTGKTEEARRVYERLTREHPDSDYAREADQRLKALS